MSKDNGGQAFPTVDYAKPVGGGAHMMTITGGMTLRDYFAAKAMQAMASAPMGKFTHTNFEDLTGSAYAMADAMLAERAK